MTELTQQEIEQERVKFEEIYPIVCSGELNKNDIQECDYEKSFYFKAFQVWLARAELAKDE